MVVIKLLNETFRYLHKNSNITAIKVFKTPDNLYTAEVLWVEGNSVEASVMLKSHNSLNKLQYEFDKMIEELGFEVKLDIKEENK